MRPSSNKICTATLLITAAMLYSSVISAGPPTGPKKIDCRAALTATKLQDLAFGDFEASTGGTVVISTAGGRTATGGVVLISSVATAARFSVLSSLAGCEAYPVKITLPNTATLSTGGGATMTAATFASSPATGFTITPFIPVDVDVSATLTVGAGQTAGPYNTTTAFTVQFSH